MVNFFFGLDLGKANDYTAICILERRGGNEPSYHVRWLERVRGLDYPEVVSKVEQIMRSRPLINNASLIVDATGVGAPVVDMFVKAGLNPIAIFIHGGNSVNHEGSSWKVPKRDLISNLQLLFQTEKLKISDRLKLKEVFQSELLNFKVKIADSGHDSYEASGSSHDDLVLSVALAAWYASRQSQNQSIVVNFANLRGESVSSYGCCDEPWLSDE
jgi:hypothetical protein